MTTFSHLVFLTLATALISMAILASADIGTATFYTPPYNPSACDGLKNEGVMIAAASDAFWNRGATCGKRFHVKCVSATNLGDPHPCRGNRVVEVKIVDYCPAGCRGTIDLSQEAFSSIANPDAGKINIEFHQI